MSNRKQCILFALAVFAVACAGWFASCSATLKVQSSEQTPIIGKGEVELHLEAGPPRTVELGPTAAMPAGSCVKITFRDARGKETGSSDTTVGGPPVKVPPGSKSVTVSPCDPVKPKEEDKDKPQKGGPKPPKGQQSMTASSGELFFYRSVPIDISDGRGKYVDFTVRATDHEEADRIASDFIGDGVRKPCPPEVQTYGFVYASILGGGGVRLAFIANDVPASFSFTYDGKVSSRSSKLFTINGWYAQVVTIPHSDIDLSFGGSNAVQFTLTTAEQEIGATVEVQH